MLCAEIETVLVSLRRIRRSQDSRRGSQKFKPGPCFADEWAMGNATKMGILLVLGALLPAPAPAMDHSRFRRSDRIEDRRVPECETTVDCAAKADQAVAFFRKLGDQAAKNAFPFHCAPFKPLRKGFAQIGRELRDTKSYAELLANAEEAIGKKLSSEALEDVNLCAGAKEAQWVKLETTRVEIRRIRNLAGADQISHSVRPEEMNVKLSGYSDLGIISKAREGVTNALNGDCLEAKRIVGKQLVGLDYYSYRWNALLAEKQDQLYFEQQKVSAIKCGDSDVPAGAPGAPVTTAISTWQ